MIPLRKIDRADEISPPQCASDFCRKKAELGEDSPGTKEKHETQMSMRHMEGKRTVPEVDRALYKFVGEKIITYYADWSRTTHSIKGRASHWRDPAVEKRLNGWSQTVLMPERLVEKRPPEK